MCVSKTPTVNKLGMESEYEGGERGGQAEDEVSVLWLYTYEGMGKMCHIYIKKKPIDFYINASHFPCDFICF